MIKQALKLLIGLGEAVEAYRGAQRLRLHLGVPAGVETVRFRYHFTVFGEVKLT